MDFEDPLFFLVIGQKVIVPVEPYKQGKSLMAMYDCQRLFPTHTVEGVINSRVLKYLASPEPKMTAAPGQEKVETRELVAA